MSKISLNFILNLWWSPLYPKTEDLGFVEFIKVFLDKDPHSRHKVSDLIVNLYNTYMIFFRTILGWQMMEIWY